MTEPVEGNRALWDELTPIHVASSFYDVESFRAGRSSLRHIELAELGDVAGKKLLHLQCHFGMDSLSWARLGAEVTGTDLSSRSIEVARSLAEELGIEARFVCCELYDLPAMLDGTFDLVFTSYGALPWLPDTGQWADVVRHFLRPGGVFYMVEFHPVIHAFGDGPQSDLAESYFHEDEPHPWRAKATYADPTASVSSPSYQWHHPVADVLSSLIDRGLAIEFLHEHPASPERLRPWMVQDTDGWWRAPLDALPALFSLRAVLGTGSAPVASTSGSQTRRAKFSIRRSRPEDIATCQEIVRSLPDYFTPDVPAKVANDFAMLRGWVAGNRNDVFGFTVVDLRSVRAAEILWMAVRGDRRRSGVGSALLVHVLHVLGAEGVQLVEVKTLDGSAEYEPYDATRWFWEDHGFIQVDTIDPLPGWQAGNPAAIYVRSLK